MMDKNNFKEIDDGRIEEVAGGIPGVCVDLSGLKDDVQDFDPKNIDEICDRIAGRVGCPYIWGGAGPDDFDCGGFSAR